MVSGGEERLWRVPLPPLFGWAAPVLTN